MTLAIALWIEDDIQWFTPKEFDPPTAQDIERERQLSIAMNLWMDDYDDRMTPQRDAWCNQDHEGWGQVA